MDDYVRKAMDLADAYATACAATAANRDVGNAHNATRAALQAHLAAQPVPAQVVSEPLSDDTIIAIWRRALDKCFGSEAQALYVAREVERHLATPTHQAAEPTASDMVLVPRKPTEVMVSAFESELLGAGGSYFDWWTSGGDAAYRAMLDAAPVPTQSQGSATPGGDVALNVARQHLQSSIDWMMEGKKTGPCIGVDDMRVLLAATPSARDGDARDAERLNFIEREWFYQPREGVVSFVFNELWEREATSLRASIDAAIAASAQGEADHA